MIDFAQESIIPVNDQAMEFDNLIKENEQEKASVIQPFTLQQQPKLNLFTTNLELQKEKNEMLAILKDIINCRTFEVKRENFNKDFLKEIFKSNPDLKKYLYILSEKTKANFVKNRNLFFNLNTKDESSDDTKFFYTYHCKSISMMQSEPSFIVELNRSIYSLLISTFNSMKTTLKTDYISLANGDSKYQSSHNLISAQPAVVIQQTSPIVNNIYPNDDDADFEPSVIKGTIRLIYDIKYFLSPKAIISEMTKVRSGNLSSKLPNSSFGFKLKALEFSWYHKTYSNLINNLAMTSEEIINNKKRRTIITESIKENNKVLLFELISKGIPPSLRKEVYSFLLGIDILNDDEDYNKAKLATKFSEDMIILVDSLIAEDMKIVSNTENFFLHSEMISNLLKYLTRDTNLLFEVQTIKPIIVLAGRKPASSTVPAKIVPFPPSGIIPFQGLGFQCGVFSYLSNDIKLVYSLFSAFYCKFFCKVSSFSSESDSLLSLIYNFENIFSSVYSEIFNHLNTVNFDIKPEMIKWFMNSFAELLSVQDVFIINDLVLISESLHIYVITALAIVNYKRKEILANISHDEILNVLYSVRLEEIRIVELMKTVLS